MRPGVAAEIGERLATRQFAARLDVNRQRLRRHEARVERDRDGERIVHHQGAGAPARAHQLEIMLRGVAEKLGQRRAVGRAGASRGETLEIGLAQHGLARHVEADQDRRRRALLGEGADDDARRLRVVPDVELRRRRRIAADRERAAHRHEQFQPAHEAGIARDGERDIGQRPGGDEDQLALVLERGGQQRVDRMRARRRRRGLRQHGAAEAGDAVDVAGVVDMAEQRRRRALPDRHIGAAREGQHGAGVAGGLGEPDIAGDRRDADEARAGGGERIEQGEGVVDAGVDVENQRRHAFLQKPMRSLARQRTNSISATAVNPIASPIHSPKPPSGVRKPSATPIGAPMSQ